MRLAQQLAALYVVCGFGYAIAVIVAEHRTAQKEKREENPGTYALAILLMPWAWLPVVLAVMVLRSRSKAS